MIKVDIETKFYFYSKRILFSLTAHKITLMFYLLYLKKKKQQIFRDNFIFTKGKVPQVCETQSTYLKVKNSFNIIP